MRENIIFITVDSLRFDRVGYFSKKRLTPNIDGLSKEGAVFRNCFAAGPGTSFSFPSLIVRNLHPFRDYGLERNEVTIAEEVKREGYHTAAFTAYNYWVSRYLNYDRGFVHFRDYFEGIREDRFKEKMEFEGQKKMLPSSSIKKVLSKVVPSTFQKLLGYYLMDDIFRNRRDIASSRSGEVLTENVISYLKNEIPEPFFLWIHYMDPHSPYIPPRRFTRYPPFKIILINTQLNEVKTGKRTMTIALRIHMKRLYEEEIRYTDFCIGQLISTVKKLHLYDRTTILLTSDHGEMLDEHGLISHHPELYESLIRVPLIVKGRDFPAGMISDELVHHGDLPQTLYHIAKGQDNGDSFGRSLISTLNSGKGSDYICTRTKHDGNRKILLDLTSSTDPMISTPYNLYGLRTKRFKLIYDEEGRKYELYDLKDDPGERRNIFQEKGKAAAELVSLMEGIIERNRSEPERRMVRSALDKLGLKNI